MWRALILVAGCHGPAKPAPLRQPSHADALMAECETNKPHACRPLYDAAHARELSGPDTKRAVDLFEQMCDRGRMDACYAAGNLLVGATYKLVPLVGEIRDLDDHAERRLTRACDGGIAGACEMMVVMGFARDPFARATQACDLGSGVGCFFAGSLRTTGIGVAPDLGDGYRLLVRGCKLGNRAACSHSSAVALEWLQRDVFRLLGSFAR